MVDINFHPKPQTKPTGIRFDPIALVDKSLWLTDEQFKKIDDHAKRQKAKGNGFHWELVTEEKPCPTILKNMMIGGSNTRLIYQNNRYRYLTDNELKQVGSFPQNFDFINRKNLIERIGNSVPPNLMYAIAAHIKRWTFISTSQPTVISTFAGCGGSSLGYKLAGFKELLAVEWDDMAVKTFKLNFKDVPVYHGDIKALKSSHCMGLAGVKRGQLDVFDGSPPCQGFSNAGNRRLNDERNSLFLEYARLLNDLQPKVFVMENVKGMVSGHMKQVYLECIKTLRECGYAAKGQIMNAKYYNVPQSRERVIIVGIRNDLYNVL